MSIPVLTGLWRAAELTLLTTAALGTGLLLHPSSAGVHTVASWGEYIVVSAIALTTLWVMANRQDLYGLPALLDPAAQTRRLGLALAAGALTSSLALGLLHLGQDLEPTLLLQPLAWTLASSAALLAFRSGMAWALRNQVRAGRLATRVALIGANQTSLSFIHDAATHTSVTILGVYDDGDTCLPDDMAGERVRGTVGDLIALARHEPVDAIIISLPPEATDRIAQLRERLAGIAADIFLASEAPGQFRAGAQFTTFGAVSVLVVSERPLKDWPAFKKTMFDRVASACFLVMATPLMMLIAIVVKLGSDGPVFFRQEREGLNGVPFTMFKFRTMYCLADNDQSMQATQGDRRITRAGHWLRRLSLDELPQLWNVLRGDMSLVGPRPHLATTRAGERLFHEVVPHYQARHRMKPGLTGWAQVQGLRGETRTELELTERVTQDLFYIENWSLGLDLRIILRTFLHEIVSRSGRAY